MSNIVIAQAKARRASLHAVVTRADGTVENLGMIAYYHRNPLLRFLGNALITIRRSITG